MEKIRSKIAGHTRISMILLTLLALSGMAAIVSADVGVEVSMLYGTVTLNDADASPGTVIDAYIDGALRGSFETEASGKYAIAITGNGLEDEGKVVTFTVGDAAVTETVLWHASIKPRENNLCVGDQSAGDLTAQQSTDDNTPSGGTSGGYVSPATTPTKADAQPASWENVTSAPSVTATLTATSPKKLAEKPETKGVLIGFEAVFAIIGLLTVVYLVRRR